MAYGMVNVPGVTQAELDEALEEAKRYTDEHTEKDVSKAYAVWRRANQGRPVSDFAQTLPDGSYRIDDYYAYRIRHITASGIVFTWLEGYTDEGFYYATLYRNGVSLVCLSTEPGDEGLYIGDFTLASTDYVDTKISGAISAAY